MKHKQKLPNARFGAGLLTKLENEDAFILPVRDAGAPSQPKRLDGQMGIKEKDESIEDAQAREGTEETVFVRESNGSAAVGVPETIRDTKLEHNLIRTYRNAQRDEESSLPELDRVFYFESSQKVPEGMPAMEAESGGYQTGYTWEVTDDSSMELMNDHEVGISSDDIVDGDTQIYDLEHMETDDGVIHFDRPTALLEPTEDKITVFRSGELEYQGDIVGFQNFLQEEYDWGMDEVDTYATAKVQARLDAYGDNLGAQTSDDFIKDEYIEAVSDIGNAFQNFPSP